MTVVFDLSKIDWNAFAAIAGGLSAIASAFAARGAFAAVSESKRIAEDMRDREVRRRRETAAVLATPFAFEIEEVRKHLALVVSFGALKHPLSGQEHLFLVQTVKGKVHAPLIEKCVERFADFDIETGRELGKFLSSLLQAKHFSDVSEETVKSLPMKSAEAARDRGVRQCQQVIEAATTTLAALGPYLSPTQEGRGNDLFDGSGT